MTELTSRDYFILLYYCINISIAVFLFMIGLYGAIRPIAANIIWLIIWGCYFALLISLPAKALDVQE